jgi:phytoene synthase
VASRLLPAESRGHIAAIYAFARVADDFADEGDRAAATRLALLDDWQTRLRGAASGIPADDGTEEAAIFTALGETMRVCRLPVSLFEDLLSAFRQDVLVRRYETWSDLLDYCRRSANPIGRLVLRVAAYDDPRLDRQSDAVCTALQLTNFWQDLERDWQKGRVYVPHDLLAASGADLGDLDRRRMTREWQAALSEASRRTRALFAEGRGVADGVRGRLRWELRATCAGGDRILTRLEQTAFDVFGHRPRLGWRDALPIAWRVLAW